MADVIVGATETDPTHDISLSDGVTTYGFLLSDQSGNRNERAIKRDPIQRTPLKTAQGAVKYSDFELPYTSIAQDNWQGGRGNEDFERDTTRFYDAWAANTMHEGQVICGPMPTYATGYRSAFQNMPGDVVNSGSWAAYGNMSWWNMYGVTGTGQSRIFASKFTSDVTTFNADCAWIWIKRVGTPNQLQIDLCAHSAGDNTIGAVLKTVYISGSDNSVDVISQLYKLDWTGTQQIANGTSYWLLLTASADDDAADHWEIGYSGATVSGRRWMYNTGTNVYADATSELAAMLYFRLTDADVQFKAHFFEYKGQLYFATESTDGTAMKLYMNGYRGVADANSGDKTKLNDSTQTGWTNVLTGAVAKLIDGRGSLEPEPYRTITAGASGALTVDPTWYVAHNASGQDITQYVILGTNTFSLLQTGDYSCHDVENTGDVVFFVFNEEKAATKGFRKYREFTDGSVWTSTFTAGTSLQASYVKAIRHPTDGTYLYWARNHDGERNSTITRTFVPKNFNDTIKAARAYLSASPNGFMKEQVISNVTTTVEGTTSAKIEVAAGFTTGLIASDVVASEDWRAFNKINMTIKSSVALSSGQLRLDIDDTALCGSPIVSVNFPAMNADITYSYQGDYILDMSDFNIAGTTGANAIVSVGLNLTSDPGACTLYITFNSLVPETEDIEVGDSYEKITGLEAYGDPEELWVLKEGSVWKIDQNDQISSIPLRELESVRDEYNGSAHLVHDVYLLFSLREGIQRYFRNNLEDVGPNRDAGLPDGRQGRVAAMVGYPGRYFVAIHGDATNTACVMCYNGLGYHEIWRAPAAGMRIWNLYLQVIPGSASDRLWISCGADVLWVPVTLTNPYFIGEYRYTHESTLTTSWLYGGMRDVVKSWKSVKVFSEGLASDNKIVLYYQTDDNSTWTKLGTDYTTSPVQEVNLATTGNVSGKRIRFRASFQTTSAAQTPKLVAMIVEGLARVPIKFQYSLNFLLPDGVADLEDIDPDETTLRIETIVAKLDEWATNLTILTMRTINGGMDNKSVIIEPISFAPLKVLPDEQYESVIAQATVVEV